MTETPKSPQDDEAQKGTPPDPPQKGEPSAPKEKRTEGSGYDKDSGAGESKAGLP